MVRTPRELIPVVAALLLLAGCSQASSATPPVAPPVGPPAAAAHGAQRRLVFFMNPNGRPCQMQEQILRGMGAELASRVQLVFYRTTEPTELIRFEQYGIRSLPALLLTDAAGTELRRATPGIQGEEQVRALIAP